MMSSEENVLSIQERDKILSRLSAIEGFERVRFIIEVIPKLILPSVLSME